MFLVKKSALIHDKEKKTCKKIESSKCILTRQGQFETKNGEINQHVLSAKKSKNVIGKSSRENVIAEIIF